MPSFNVPTQGFATSLPTNLGIQSLEEVRTGGQIKRGAASHGRTIAGSQRLGALMTLRSGPELEGIRSQQVSNVLNQYLAQGYSRTGPASAMMSLGSGLAQFISISPLGEVTTSIGSDPAYVAAQQKAQKQALSKYQKDTMIRQIGTSAYLSSLATQAANKGQTKTAQTYSQQASQAQARELEVAKQSAEAARVNKIMIASGGGTLTAGDTVRNLRAMYGVSTPTKATSTPTPTTSTPTTSYKSYMDVTGSVSKNLGLTSTPTTSATKTKTSVSNTVNNVVSKISSIFKKK